MLHLIVISAYFLFIALVVIFCHRRGMRWPGKIGVVIFLLLAPFWDIFLAKGIMQSFKLSNSPLQQINRTIEKPLSVLWLDEVWPGFDEYGRHWMVKNYLDGVNLQTLALNDGEGKLYLFQATHEDYTESVRLLPELKKVETMVAALRSEAQQAKDQGKDNPELWKKYRNKDAELMQKRNDYEKLREHDIAGIIKRVETYQYTGGSLPAGLPSLNYRVRFDRLRLPEWQEKFIWCDEITILDDQKNETVAFSKRCLGYTPNIADNIVLHSYGERSSPFSGGARLGDERAYEFDDQALFGYAGKRGNWWSRDLLERRTYKSTSLDWKEIQKKKE